MQENTPNLWQHLLPQKTQDQHKYDHGHALIYGAPQLTGATRLAAEACARIGTGLVTVSAPAGTNDIYRTSLPAPILVRPAGSFDAHDPRITARLYGPGGLSTQPDYTSALPTILDADALYDLPDHLGENFILTPHQGEFDKAFPALTGTRQARVQQAAQNLGCYIVLKGAQTLIAAPDGRCCLNDHASPWLATAGTGDVLAGMITGLAAQNMSPFEACCAATWLHGESALQDGPYLIASDLNGFIPKAIQNAKESA